MINNHKSVRWRRVYCCCLFFLTITLPLTAQDHVVSGKITDGLLPISGASIIVKNTTVGAVSDFDGRYTITARPTDTLQISYLGYTTQTIPVHNRTTIDVQLLEDAMALGEVQINAGYYTVKDRERTGSIVRVTAKDIEGLPIISPLEALQGRMAGVEVTLGSGITGLAPSIRIRGTNSLRNDGNYPLYVINGIPLNSEPLRSAGRLTNLSGLDPLSTINPNNIGSIEVLKDADATAIYGSRGANGVVLITTKKKSAVDGKTSLSINILSGVSEVANKMKLLNTPQYLSMRKQAFENDGVIPTQANAFDLMLWDQNRYTDWQEELFGGTAFMTNVNIGVSGGNEYTSYLLGGSYQNQSSIFPGNFDYNKGTANLNLNHRSKDNKFLLDLSVNYGIDDNSLFYGNNFVNSALTTPPNAPAIYKEDGGLNWEHWIGDNPLAVLEQPQDIHTDNLLTNMSLSYKILKGLQLKTNLGYSTLNSEEQIRFFIEAYSPDLWDYIKLNSRQSFSKRQSWIAEPQITYDLVKGKAEINTLIGATFQDNKNSYFALEGSGYTDKSLMKNLGAADAVRVLTDNNIHYRYSALFGRLGLSFDKKYFLNLTGRRDGSSRFGPDKQFSNFCALGSAWIFSEENIIAKNISFLNYGKLRASYGTTGSDQIGDYNFLDTYQPTDGAGGLYPTQLFNAKYSWEVNKKLEAALELGFFNGRVHLEVSWHRNRSSNQLVGYPLPAITGFTSIQANLPALVQNTGWEFQLLTSNSMNKHFKWQTSLNITIPENKLVEFDGIEKTSYANRYQIGYPLNIHKLYQYDGIDPETGFYQIVDINEDGRYNNDDRVVIRNMGRKYYGGINNHFQYKGFSLNFLFEYIRQNNLSYIFSASAPGRFNNKPVEFLNAWEKAGDNQDIQKISQSSIANTAFNNASNSSKGIEDASFLRLKNIALSYQLPNNLLEKVNIQSVQLYLQAYNLFTITPYKGLDPQSGRAIPPLRTISFGVNLNL